MERTDGQEGFDYKGIYDRVIPKQRIESTGDDGRKTTVEFEVAGNHTFIRETFQWLKYALENIMAINHKNLKELFPQNYKRIIEQSNM